MRVFVTGATGFIGSRIVDELVTADHQVLGLTRSMEGAARLAAQGVEPLHGVITDLDVLTDAARDCDAVIHTAFDHDFSRYVESCETDRQVILALGRGLARDRPLLVTSATGMGEPGPGQPAREGVFDPAHPLPRVATELAAESLKADGANVIVIRLPQVHDTVRQGLISFFIDVARQSGVSAWVGDGASRMSAAHVSDVARLYRLALEQGRPGARYHAVAEGGVVMRDIAEVIAAGLGVPTRSIPADAAAAHFGPMAMFASLDLIASSAATQAELDWLPTGPDLLTDLRDMDYGRAT